MPEFRCALTLPTHPDSAHLARACVRELMTVAGFPADQAELLLLAAAGACPDLVRAAAALGEAKPFDVVGVLTPHALSLAILERGAPFDPSRPASAPIPGPAWARLTQAVDKAHWRSRGNAGME